MTELKIEFLEIKGKNRSHVLVNGVNFCDVSYCYEKRWFYIYDEELFNALSEYEIRDLFKYFEHIDITIEMADNIWLRVKIDSKHNYKKKETWALASLGYDIEDWDKPWSIKQYFYSLLEKLKPISNLEVSCDINDENEDTGEPIYDLYNGIGIGKVVEDLSISLKSIYNQISALCISMSKEVESDLALSLNENKVERSIHFAPEYHQAGLDILNFFGTYLREQYPKENASVKIEQHGLKVKMVIETEDGKTETIEKALHEYELIITGVESPAKFSQNEMLILELKNELRIAQFRLESQKDLIGMQNGRIDQLLNIVGEGLSQKNQVMVDFKPNISLSNSVVINQDIAAALSNVNELISEIPQTSNACSALKELENSLSEFETSNDSESVRRSPAMSKFKRFIDKVNDNGSEFNEAIDKIDSGWEIFSELAGKYNKLAKWCCLPVVPSALIK
jgi:hypothetical protein